MRNKLITILVIAMFLLPYLPVPCVTAANPWDEYKFWKKEKKNLIKNLRNYLAYEHYEHEKLILYLLLLGIYTWNITTDIKANLETYVLMNPKPLEPSVLNVMNFFIFNLQVVYILAIAATGLYIAFSAGNPKKRALAKGMIGRLVLGILLVSVSPQIINLFFDFTSGMAATILNQADSQVAATVYTDLLWKTYWPSVFIIMIPMMGHTLEQWTHHAIEHGVMHNIEHRVEGEYKKEYQKKFSSLSDSARDNYVEQLMQIGTPEAIIADLAGQIKQEQEDNLKKDAKMAGKKAAESSWWGTLEYQMRKQRIKIAPRPEQTFAFLMAEISLVFGLYGFLALRYMMLMIWTVLFPVSLFLSSFQLTRGIGRNMIEQTIFWSILQIFYAVTIDVIAIGFNILPEGFSFFGVGLQYAGISLFFVSFFSVAAAMMLMLTPIILLMLSQRLTQMDVG